VTGGPFLTRLRLHDFRNYDALDWAPEGRVVAIFGPNGSGKTNLLEAISLLGGGRGLRRARREEWPRAGGSGTFSIAGRFLEEGRPLEIATGLSLPEEGGRRLFRLDGEVPRSQGEVAARLAFVWLVPAMDRLFQGGASARRRFLDRLVAAFEPAFAREVAAYHRALALRQRMLEEGAEADWLEGVEGVLAQHAVAVAAARRELVRALDAKLLATPIAGFEPPRLRLDCPIAAQLAEQPALAVEEALRASMRAFRRSGALRAERTGEGGGDGADFDLVDPRTGRRGAMLSSGEQRSFLLNLVLAHLALVRERRQRGPILLLDEPFLHLDAARKEALIAALAGETAQIFLTGAMREEFLAMANFAAGWSCREGRLRPDESFHFPRHEGVGESGTDG
jgi:DNA replication and repair protein RecF